MRFWEMTTNALKLFKGVKKLSRTHQQMSEKKYYTTNLYLYRLLMFVQSNFFFFSFLYRSFLSHLTKIYDIQYTRPRIRM